MDHFEKYLAQTYRYIAYRGRSEKEVRDYLAKKNAPSEVIEKLIALLYEQKFLNDEEFARGWMLARARSRPKGKRVIRMELQRKGIDKEIIDLVLAEVHEDVPDELTQAKNLIVRRVEKLSGEPKQIIYNKVGSFLARRGFGWDITKRAIDDVMRKEV